MGSTDLAQSLEGSGIRFYIEKATRAVLGEEKVFDFLLIKLIVSLISSSLDRISFIFVSAIRRGKNE